MAYSDETKQMALMVLRNLKGNYEATSRWMAQHEGVEISGMQIARWDKGDFIDPVIVDNVETLKKQDLADCLEKLAYQMIQAAPNKIADASLAQTMTSTGIAIDKMLLLRGEATTITQTNVSREDAALRIMEIVGKYANNSRPAESDE